MVICLYHGCISPSNNGSKMTHSYLGKYICFMFIYSALASNPSSGCHSIKEHVIAEHLATKTPYRFVMNSNDKPINIPGCEPQRIWLLVRHGTRYPGRQMIFKMTTQLSELRDIIVIGYRGKKEYGPDHICAKDIGRLKAWNLNVQESQEKHLAHEGEDEMIELAERFQKRFPKLFPGHFDNNTYKFQYTATQRTGESARYFTIGLFGRSGSLHVWFPEPLAKDPVLRFYKLCDRWRTQVDKNPATVLQKRKFERGPEMLAALKRITTRLGLNGTIGVADAEVMYLTCTFETAWEKRGVSPWCSVFSEEDLKVFEYSEDLKYYWVDGYGYELTYKQACPALKDMMEHLQPSSDNESGQHTTVVYFSHSGTMLKLLCHLGLYKDSGVLLHSNYDSMAGQRKWRVGKIDSFGSNLAFVLFQCGNEAKLMTLHQERPVVLPGCPQDLLCPVALFRQLYSESLENCNFLEMCAL
ncbi:multiple inositol polyphosphate phosphatase 1 isoform X1 [Schistocerca nitens]|uniref:multiple inositol polyphosphate phosphatase 1 isoform X1 n=2 Tax=Schistocerca nitens TaxID=7011 RepID=UPI002118D5BA|nr:multiple inositol polyphosphate phosphatase 1 isoform X1 [Schistocerca nitens]